MSVDPLAELRGRIAANDEQIVELVNERLRLVGQLWRVKRDVGAPVRDLERERALVTHLEAANGGPLSEAGLGKLVDELLALTRQELDSVS